MPKNMITAVKNLLKKEYFGDRCKIKENDVTCSAEPIKNISIIRLCRDKNGKNGKGCMELEILGMIIWEVKAGKTYKLLIEEYKDEK